jgi:HTH-type transcriptional regulator / antitoxin HigA
MQIKPIRTKADHKAALKLVSALVDRDPPRGTPDGDLLEIMSTLVAAYEARHFPMAAADPIEAIKFRMEQQGLAPRDLTPMIGRLNRVYEVLARRRPLTMTMVWRLHTQLGIPAESLIRPSEAAVS